MFDHVDYIITTVSDMARSVGFYRDALGLKLRFESEMWSEFETGVTTLALHGGGTAPERLAENATKGRAGTCMVGFEVTDIAQTVAELKSDTRHQTWEVIDAKLIHVECVPKSWLRQWIQLEETLDEVVDSTWMTPSPGARTKDPGSYPPCR